MSIKEDGLDEMYKRLQTLLQDSKSQKTVRKILYDFGVVAKSRIRSNFSAGIDPYGVTWAPLKAGGRRIKSSGGKSTLDRTAKPLLDTGRLVGSISYKTFEKSSSKDGLSTALLLYNKGSNVQYGDYHQFGIGVTARPFYPTPERGLPDSWGKDLSKITDKILSKLLNS